MRSKVVSDNEGNNGWEKFGIFKHRKHIKLYWQKIAQARDVV